MRPGDLVKALEAVPAARLKLPEIARQHVRDGELDLESLLPLAAEVDLAATEVRTYIKATETVVRALRRLMDCERRNNDGAEFAPGGPPW